MLGAVAAPSLAVDQTEKWEISLLGSGSNDNDFDAGGFSASASAGYYFTDQFQVQGRQSVTYSDFGDSSWSAVTRVGAFYHFNYSTEQRLVPYVGGTIGYVYGDAVSDTFVAGPEAGVKFFVNDTTFLFGSVTYDFFFDDGDEADDAFSDGQFVYGLGIGFQF
jgi:hypothetical protein